MKPRASVASTSTNYNAGMEEVDLTILRRPVLRRQSGALELKEAYDNGTDEIRCLLKNGCNIIYECTFCLNLFRNLINFVSHKRCYCQDIDNNNVLDVNKNCYINEDILANNKKEENDSKQNRVNRNKTNNKSPNNFQNNKNNKCAGKATSKYNLEKRNKDLTGIIEHLNLREQNNRKLTLVDFYDQVNLKLTLEENLEKNQTVKLDDIPNSNMAVYQTINKQECDNIKTEISELNEINNFKAIVGPDGRVFEYNEEIPHKNIVSEFINENERLEKNLKCQICNLKFTTAKTLKLHIQAKHIPSTYVYKCPICSQTYLRPAAVIRHLIIDHRKTQRRIRLMRDTIIKKKMRIDEVKVKAPSRPLSHLHKNNTNHVEETKAWLENIEKPTISSPVCPYCGKKFERRAALAAHVQNCIWKNHPVPPSKKSLGNSKEITSRNSNCLQDNGSKNYKGATVSQKEIDAKNSKNHDKNIISNSNDGNSEKILRTCINKRKRTNPQKLVENTSHNLISSPKNISSNTSATSYSNISLNSLLSPVNILPNNSITSHSNKFAESPTSLSVNIKKNPSKSVSANILNKSSKSKLNHILNKLSRSSPTNKNSLLTRKQGNCSKKKKKFTNLTPQILTDNQNTNKSYNPDKLDSLVNDLSKKVRTEKLQIEQTKDLVENPGETSSEYLTFLPSVNSSNNTSPVNTKIKLSANSVKKIIEEKLKSPVNNHLKISEDNSHENTDLNDIVLNESPSISHNEKLTVTNVTKEKSENKTFIEKPVLQESNFRNIEKSSSSVKLSNEKQSDKLRLFKQTFLHDASSTDLIPETLHNEDDFSEKLNKLFGPSDEELDCSVSEDQNYNTMEDTFDREKFFKSVSQRKDLLFYCRMCKKPFTVLSNIRRHISMFHYKRFKFGCHICPYRAFRKYDVVNHLNSAHSINDDYNLDQILVAKDCNDRGDRDIIISDKGIFKGEKQEDIENIAAEIAKASLSKRKDFHLKHEGLLNKNPKILKKRGRKSKEPYVVKNIAKVNDPIETIILDEEEFSSEELPTPIEKINREQRKTLTQNDVHNSIGSVLETENIFDEFINDKSVKNNSIKKIKIERSNSMFSNSSNEDDIAPTVISQTINNVPKNVSVRPFRNRPKVVNKDFVYDMKDVLRKDLLYSNRNLYPQIKQKFKRHSTTTGNFDDSSRESNVSISTISSSSSSCTSNSPNDFGLSNKLQISRENTRKNVQKKFLGFMSTNNSSSNFTPQTSISSTDSSSSKLYCFLNQGKVNELSGEKTKSIDKIGNQPEKNILTKIDHAKNDENIKKISDDLSTHKKENLNAPSITDLLNRTGHSFFNENYQTQTIGPFTDNSKLNNKDKKHSIKIVQKNQYPNISKNSNSTISQPPLDINLPGEKDFQEYLKYNKLSEPVKKIDLSALIEQQQKEQKEASNKNQQPESVINFRFEYVDANRNKIGLVNKEIIEMHDREGSDETNS